MALIRRTYAEILEAAWPGLAWSIHGDNLDTFVVHGGAEKPTKEDLDAAAPAAWLLLAQRRAKAVVDQQAERERAVHITAGSGQAMVYLEKQREARECRDRHAAGIAPIAQDYPLLSAAVGLDVDPRSGAFVDSVLQAAEVVMLMASQWATIAAAIEGRRLGAKRSIEAAGSVEEVEAVMAAAGWTVP